jgi:hypothetical protein
MPHLRNNLLILDFIDAERSDDYMCTPALLCCDQLIGYLHMLSTVAKYSQFPARHAVVATAQRYVRSILFHIYIAHYVDVQLVTSRVEAACVPYSKVDTLLDRLFRCGITTPLRVNSGVAVLLL